MFPLKQRQLRFFAGACFLGGEFRLRHTKPLITPIPGRMIYREVDGLSRASGIPRCWQ
jgi:hypothetical protein